MRKILEDKRWRLALSFLGLVSLTLLVGAMKTLGFNPAQPVGFSRADVRSIDVAAVIHLLDDAAQVPFWRQVTFWLGVLAIAGLISSLLSPELRKKLLRAVLRIASFALILFYVIKNNPGAISALLLMFPALAQMGEVTAGEETAPPVFQPPQIPSYMSFFVTFGLILLGIGVFIILNRWLQNQKQLASARLPLKEIADIARLSLKNIEAGQDSNDAIINCYNRMSETVSVKRGLQRERAMTPAEFVLRLERAGLPREPVIRLTRLFESVRYGRHASGAAEINEAVACLSSILKYCGDAQ